MIKIRELIEIDNERDNTSNNYRNYYESNFLNVIDKENDNKRNNRNNRKEINFFLIFLVIFIIAYNVFVFYFAFELNLYPSYYSEKDKRIMSIVLSITGSLIIPVIMYSDYYNLIIKRRIKQNEKR